MIKNIFYGLILYFYPFRQAENHAKSSVNSDFDKAIKLIEEKNFFEAFKVFSDLAEADVPEAQYNLIFAFL